MASRPLLHRVNDHPKKMYELHSVSISNHSSLTGFLNHIYRKKSTSTQIPHDTGLTTKPTLAKNSSLAGDWNSDASSTISKQHVLNHVTNLLLFLCVCSANNCELNDGKFTLLLRSQLISSRLLSKKINSYKNVWMWNMDS